MKDNKKKKNTLKIKMTTVRQKREGEEEKKWQGTDEIRIVGRSLGF